MTLKFKNPHKIRLAISLTVFIAGLAAIGYTFTPYSNPPQCGEGQAALHATNQPGCIIGANIGAGILFLFGLFIVWLGALGLLASFAYQARQRNQHAKQKQLFGALAVVFVAPFIAWALFVELPASRATEQAKQDQAAFQTKYRSNFVAYTTPPNWNTVSEQSGSVAYIQNASLALYLNQCEAGKSIAQYASGSTYFVFSGVKDNTCVFYTHTQPTTASTWDNLLTTKCTWNLAAGNDNTPLFSAGQNGIAFGDFLTKHCNAAIH